MNDMVITRITMVPTFGGTREDVLRYLRGNPQVGRWCQVMLVENSGDVGIMSVDDYMAKYADGNPI